MILCFGCLRLSGCVILVGLGEWVGLMVCSLMCCCCLCLMMSRCCGMCMRWVMYVVMGLICLVLIVMVWIGDVMVVGCVCCLMCCWLILVCCVIG